MCNAMMSYHIMSSFVLWGELRVEFDGQISQWVKRLPLISMSSLEGAGPSLTTLTVLVWVLVLVLELILLLVSVLKPTALFLFVTAAADTGFTCTAEDFHHAQIQNKIP